MNFGRLIATPSGEAPRSPVQIYVDETRRFRGLDFPVAPPADLRTAAGRRPANAPILRIVPASGRTHLHDRPTKIFQSLGATGVSPVLKLQTSTHFPLARRQWHARVACVLAWALLAAAPGCIDSQALVQAQQHESSLARFEEIEVGKFRVTLPQTPGEPSRGVVEFHAFGQVVVRDRDKVAKALKLNEPELRYRVLMAVRSLTRCQLEEPNLHTLRGQIAQVANAARSSRRRSRTSASTASRSRSCSRPPSPLGRGPG